MQHLLSAVLRVSRGPGRVKTIALVLSRGEQSTLHRRADPLNTFPTHQTCRHGAVLLETSACYTSVQNAAKLVHR